MPVTIEKVCFKKNAERIKGQFILSDGSITIFEMCKGQGWFQWGNTTENLWISVDRVEEITMEWCMENK